MALPFDTSVVCPVFIGRTAVLASFERIVEQVGNGQGQTVLVSGEAGIGKSRLVGELHLPRSVYDSVQQRTALLSDEARETLAVASVAGRQVDFALL